MRFLHLSGISLAFLFILSGCVIDNKIHFNKDFSGTYEMSFDLESILMMAAAMDSTQAVSEEQMMEELKSELGSEDLAGELNAQEGISNAQVLVSKVEGFVVRFDFTDISALNNSFNSLQDELEMMGGAGLSTEGGEKEQVDQFQLFGKKLVFRSPPTSEEEMNALGLFSGEEGEENDMSGMGSMFQMNLDFSFDRKIKSVEATGVKIISQEKKRLVAEINLGDMISSGGYELSVQLK